MSFSRNMACCAALIGMATPALADVRTAAFASASDRPLTQTSMFVGATYRLGLNRKPGIPRHRAGLGIGGMTLNSKTSELQLGRGIELALGDKGKPALRMAGMDVGELGTASRLSGGGKTALIVVGVAAALGVAALVVIDSARCEDEGRTCD